MARVVPFPQPIDLGRPWTPTRVSHIIELPPAPQWIWDNRIMRGQVTILGGEAKVGKSLLLQQLLSCCAMGLPCLGRHTERVRCFGYFCEDTDEWLTTRQFAICDAIGCQMPDFDDRFHWYSPAAHEDCLLAESEYGKMQLTPQWERLWREIDEQEAELVVIDTAGAVFGGNERNKATSTRFMRALQAKAINGNRAIILAAHPPAGNVSKGFAGDVAWIASARAGLSLERPQGYDALGDEPRYERVLRGLGANYSGGRASAKIKFDPDLKVFVADEPDEPMPTRVWTEDARNVLDREMQLLMIQARTNGAEIPADEMHPHSMPARYRRMYDRRTASNDLYASQARLIRNRVWVRVRVKKQCLLRPADGKKYDDEELWATV